MATDKNRIQTYVNDNLLEKLNEYCSENNGISQSKALEIILERFFSVDKSNEFTLIPSTARSCSTSNIQVIEVVVEKTIEPLLERIKLLEAAVYPSQPIIDGREVGLIDQLIETVESIDSTELSVVSQGELLTVLQISKALGISAKTIYKKIKLALGSSQDFNDVSIMLGNVYYKLMAIKPYTLVKILL